MSGTNCGEAPSVVDLRSVLSPLPAHPAVYVNAAFTNQADSSTVAQLHPQSGHAIDGSAAATRLGSVRRPPPLPATSAGGTAGQAERRGLRFLATSERMTTGPRPVRANGTRLRAMASSIKRATAGR